MRETTIENLARGVALARRVIAACTVAIVIVVAAGCDRSGERANSGGDQRPRVVKSDAIPDEPQRLVSLAPNVTEILFALGAGDRVTAVTKFCDYPEAATSRPTIGSFSNPDFESIVAQKPDLVVGVVSGGKKRVFERLKGVGLPYLFVRMSTIEETFEGIETIAEAIGERERGDSLVSSIRRQIGETAARWENRRGPGVLLVYGHEPIVAAGPGTFGHQMLERLGAENVLGDAPTKYPRIDIEKVIELDPERIIDTTMGSAAGDDDFWESRSVLDAVEAQRARHLTDPSILRPGPRLPEGLRILGNAVYEPDAGE